MNPWEKNIGWLAWPAVFLALWRVLLRAQNPGLMADDSGEMVAASYNLGQPHPPGYPLFCLLGRIFSYLPVGTVAFRYNILSALLALAALALVLAACRRWLEETESGFSGEIFLVLTAVFFVSYRGLFAQCLTAKGCVYTLTLFLSAVLLWLRMRGPSSAIPAPPLFLLAFCWALGMANHWQTHILWLPFLAHWIFRAKVRLDPKSILFCVTGILLGVSLYLYLPLRAASKVLPFWGHPVNVREFYWVVSRQLVAGWEPLIQSASFYRKSLEELGHLALPGGSPLLLVLVLPGLVFLWRRDRSLLESLVYFLLPVLLGVFLVHQEKNIYLMGVYLVPLAGGMAILAFYGMVWFFRSFPRIKFYLLALMAVISIAWMGWILSLEDKSRYTLMEDFGVNVLKQLPKDALLLAEGDHYVMPIWYEKYVNGKRRDVVFEPSVFLSHGWGWGQLASQAEELRGALLAQGTFEGRLRVLALQSPRHPFFYSLDGEYLGDYLNRLPGKWVERGLVFRWVEKPPFPGTMQLKDAIRAVQGERVRGLWDHGAGPRSDVSSRAIYRYYSIQKPLNSMNFIE